MNSPATASSTGLIVAPISENARKTSEIFSSPSPVPFAYYDSVQEASEYIDAFPLENQHATNSCVAHDRALSTAIYRSLVGKQVYVQPSPAFIYFYRFNTPGPGMVPDDANTITENEGVPAYADYPTPETGGDPAIDGNPPSQAVVTEAAANTIGSWLTSSNPGDIDGIAGVVNGVGVAVGILIFATIDEWSMETPTILAPALTMAEAPVQHCITVLPKSAYFGTDGKRYVIIQDSAFFGGLHYRYISEDFIAARCVRYDYIANLGKTVSPRLSPYTFENNLTVGSTGPDVFALQTALQQLGFFPSTLNGVPFQPTGNYFGMTKQAVIDFQNAYSDQILAPAGLTAATGYCGPSTRAQLNKILNPVS